jgi:hypothetical protein
VVSTATAALAGCPIESDWEVTAKADVWMLTNVYSYWVTGPGSITYTTTTSATRGTTKSASISATASGIIFKAEAKFGMDWSESTQKSASWSYNISIPSGQTARASVYKRGSRFSVRKWTTGATCATTYGSTYYQYSPFASTTNDMYCIGKDPQPGTEFVFTAGCGH